MCACACVCVLDHVCMCVCVCLFLCVCSHSFSDNGVTTERVSVQSNVIEPMMNYGVKMASVRNGGVKWFWSGIKELNGFMECN